MKDYRIPRLKKELKKIFNTALSLKLNDPALAWVSITDVVISKDLRYAKLYFTHFNNPASHDEVKASLIKTSGFFKKLIAGAHIMRTIPELSFFYDDTEDRAEKVDALLASIKDEYDEDYDPDIDIEDYLDDDDYFDYDDDEEEDDYDDFDEDDEEDR
ncbi:MAG: 30S ribosome-binding factor RbfA [Candidatus Cloacimonetes bacterium]|jgi:ribosome-binding factor A|nr:30S ribosome-binding factor RbfA [Candidatus Cloacimonadota bacterium]MCB5286561.1 30S ribosome-binding factor RbfA [Candidatus Cloacimonadota bacterium]MCK9184928.1 30S ribosome-binding factor RbfA [Candidatus Cloacimonadota bacterium]MCK9584971.1 30S ribosome-binding factor RbfA [Candidatus Cloacimonadota bacterium]MDY0228883.1 30S ribosome-binding factor RbfA [Candidatus Cloacimonadaceae bacterium]